MIRHIISIIFLTIFPLTLVTHLNYCSTSMCFEPNSIMFIGFGGTWFAAKAKRIIVFTTQFFLTNGKRLVWLSFWFFGEFYFYPSESLRVKLWKLVLGNYWTFWHLAWMDFLRNANKIERFPMMNFAKGGCKRQPKYESQLLHISIGSCVETVHFWPHLHFSAVHVTLGHPNLILNLIKNEKIHSYRVRTPESMPISIANSI